MDHPGELVVCVCAVGAGPLVGGIERADVRGGLHVSVVG